MEEERRKQDKKWEGSMREIRKKIQKASDAQIVGHATGKTLVYVPQSYV